MTTKTINKRKAFEDHVLSYFDKDHYGVDAPAIDNLKDQLKSFDYMNSAYQAGLYMVQGGSFLIYYVDQRKLLQEVYEQSDEKANSYSNDQVFYQYSYEVANAIERLANNV